MILIGKMNRKVRRFLKRHPWVREGEPSPMRLNSKRVLLGYEQLHPARFVPPDSSRTISERAMSVLLERVLDTMNQDQADLLRRYYFEQATQREIAQDLGCSQQAANARIRTAEGSFKRVLAELLDTELKAEVL